SMRAQFEDVADLSATTAAAVQELLNSLRLPLDTQRPVLVATLSDVNDLGHSSALGRIMSEQIATALVRRGYAVPEMTLRQSVLVKEGGEFMLSRDLRAMAPRQSGQAVVTGTYAVGARKVLVSLRVIRLADSRMIAAYDYDLPLGPNTDSLAHTDSD